ncbi:hypothetical protein [Kiloniella sp. b19]|uniref:hypothetical protein n=1 Tax=Kiloniella sp. GXU_MW_B19 TaxID=3141326 RepID=UPI0031E429DD
MDIRSRKTGPQSSGVQGRPSQGQSGKSVSTLSSLLQTAGLPKELPPVEAATEELSLDQLDYRTIKPFKGDLRAPGVKEHLTRLFDLARRIALSGRIMRRGSFLDLTL